MNNARMNALYTGSLRIKISYFYPEKSKIYKWCGTKVAHCSEGLGHISRFCMFCALLGQDIR